jgi:uncharacterized protein YndB with AHSA1/START domain
MKKIIAILLAALALFVVIVLVLAMTKPDSFHVERHVVIKALPETVFAHINDFKHWDRWSPWEKLDTAMQKTLSGPPSGAGAVYEWSGNEDVGRGRMEIIESARSSSIRIQLDFLDPFEARNVTTFALKREGLNTMVTWAMDGPNQFIGKVMSVFYDMDAMIGGDFEEGLSNLKNVSEGETRDIVITRTYNATPDQVWKAWTDPALVMKWWGPRGFTSPSCRIDLREGGRFVFAMRPPKEFGPNDLYTSGLYSKIVPGELLEFTQGLSDKDGNAIDPTTIGMPADFPAEIPTSLQFKRVGDRTELTATEYGWRVGQMRDVSEAGFAECLDKLGEALK